MEPRLGQGNGHSLFAEQGLPSQPFLFRQVAGCQGWERPRPRGTALPRLCGCGRVWPGGLRALRQPSREGAELGAGRDAAGRPLSEFIGCPESRGALTLGAEGGLASLRAGSGASRIGRHGECVRFIKLPVTQG